MMKNIVFDMILLEADRILAHRKQDLDLYYKDAHGDIVPLAEAYQEEVDDMLNSFLKRKKMRYVVSFTESMELMDMLKPVTNKMLRFFIKNMNYGNQVRNYSIRDIHQCTGINNQFIVQGINDLAKYDIIRFTVDKNRRTYMVNPSYFFKGSIKKIFLSTKKYTQFPKYNE